eukprot:9939494-Lingulodinium_polyedra.AAC.1
MQYYYNLHLTSPQGEDLVFGQEHHDGYTEPRELEKFLEEPGAATAEVRKRVASIRAMFKRVP